MIHSNNASSELGVSVVTFSDTGDCNSSDRGTKCLGSSASADCGDGSVVFRK